MIKLITLVTLALTLASCGQNAMETKTSQNGARAELILTIEGCNVWRFRDYVNWRYTTICPHGDATTSGSYKTGNTYYDDEIVTTRKGGAA